MYHIKEDPRSRKTAERLGQAMFQCLQSKPLNEITVSDLYRQTGIARSTFYRLFDTPEDILYYLCAQFVENAAGKFESHTFSDIQELSIASINLSIEHHELLEILVRNHRHDLLSEMYAANFRNISTRIPVMDHLDDTSFDYVQSLLYMTMSTIQTTWLKRGRKETPEELFEHLKQFRDVLIRLLDSEFPQTQ